MKILLIDGYNLLNRAYYAIPPLTTASGEYTNAVYGFLSIFFRFFDEEKPDYITVAFDLPQPTFRHERYGAYKGTRKAMPDELRAQVPTLRTLLDKMGIHTADAPGYEADDVIGTLAKKAVERGIKPVIISGDRDMLQLATDEIKIRLPKSRAGKTEVEDYHAADVLAKYNVTPKAYIDVKALMGDTSDNIPGVPSIGEVTATKIIAAYGSLENAIEHAGEIKPKKASENLIQYREQAILSQMLATIVLDAPVELELSGAGQMWSDEAYNEIKRLELKSLYRKFEAARAKISTTAEIAPPPTKPQLKIIKDRKEALQFFDKLMETYEGAAFCLLWNDASDTQPLVGMGMVMAERPSVYIPIAAGDMGGEISEGDLLAMGVIPWLASVAPKCVYDSKDETGRIRSYGVKLGGVVFDAMLAAYVLNPLQPNNNPADIATSCLNESISTLEEILDNKGKRGKDRRTVADLPEDIAAKYAVDIASALFRARPIMEEQLTASGQMELYRDMELPLANMLADMEAVGIKVDKPILTEFGKILDERLAGLTAAIYDVAGEEFNINSPAQLGVILFEKLGLKGGKKTTKGYSTAADVLEKLVGKHMIVPLVMEYRAHAKLKSTYVDGLMPLIRGSSRIHSTFHQGLTATGRLSSAEPNLQNIPIRMPLGRELRKAFIPEENMVFVDADYSQIELRLLAHMSGDAVLINAFKENQDIHRLTASQVLGIPPEDVTSEQRGNAKAVNFGIIYGISAYGLSDDLGIHVREAERYIQGYFEKYPGVKAYLDETIARAKTDGFVATLYNRRRALPELKSSNFNMRSFGERVAMNMPIQGSAADIIKIAMINVAARLKREGLSTKIILQVHDELLLEAPLEEVEQVKHILKTEMEQAAVLDVPLVADVNVCGSWYATK